MNNNCHFMFRVWLILWVLALPLIHIHPEADHAHGMPEHVHGGTYHTVLSNTPICAYENHRHHHDSFSSGEQVPQPESRTQHLPHGLEHSTYEFSVVNSSIDLTFSGSTSNSPIDVVSVSEKDTPTLALVPRTDLSPHQTRLSILIINPFSPRGPPYLFA